MHRPSAQNDPFAPIGHHWQDATHITYGVLTAGMFSRSVRLEGTVFHGREPDEHRYDFDFGALDSYGGRLTVNPTPHWSLAASYGYLKSPEGLRPDDDQRRLGASVLHTTHIGTQGDWASVLIYGANQDIGSGALAAGYDQSLVFESNVQFDDRNGVFGRLEWVEKNADELVVSGFPAGRRFDVGEIVAGYVREVGVIDGATLGVGVRGAIDILPEDLQPTYGTRMPGSIAVYGRLRPALLQRAHDGDRDRGSSPGRPPHVR
jgi:hypothetical protein